MFQTADGWITIGASQENFFSALCRIVELPELLSDPRFADLASRVRHNHELVALLEEPLRTRPSAHWLAAFEEAAIPAGPVRHFDEVFEDPHMLAREMVVETEHPVTGRFRTLGVPVKLSETPGSVRRPAPRLGEDSVERR